jgi:hypothetical protein
MRHNVYSDSDDKLKDGTYLVDSNGNVRDAELTDGYCVSLTNNTTWPASELLETAIFGFTAQTAVIGVWTHPDTGEKFIDLTAHTSNRTRAMTMAMLFKQQAIWDCKVGAAIFLEQGN